jgi:uncharacterized RDD family membrane protein YckC
LVRLPKASTSRRLLGAGTEYLFYSVAQGIAVAISLATFGVMDFAVALPLALGIALRDSHSGLFSLEKRIGQMRVVDFKSGRPISNSQAFKRNVYYLIPPLTMIFPLVGLEALLFSLFEVCVLADVLMIVFRQDGRRIGDLLAGTQVVQVVAKEPS